MKKFELIKKNLYFAIAFVVLLFAIGFVIAAWDASKASHATLYANVIEPKNGTSINVRGALNVLGALLVNGSPVVGGGGGTGPVSWSDIIGIPTGFADGIDDVGGFGGVSGNIVKTYEASINAPFGGTTPVTYSPAGWTDLDSMIIAFTPTSASNPILIMFSGTFQQDAEQDNRRVDIMLEIDGKPVPGTERVIHPDHLRLDTLAFQKITTLSASLHTVKVKIRVVAGYVNVYSRTLSIIELGGGSGGGTIYDTSFLDATVEDSLQQQNLVAQGCVKLNNEDTKYGANKWMACPSGMNMVAITDDVEQDQDAFCCPSSGGGSGGGTAQLGNCAWRPVGYDKSHYSDTSAWCLDNEVIVQLDIDSGTSGADYPIIKQVKCCKIIGGSGGGGDTTSPKSCVAANSNDKDGDLGDKNIAVNLIVGEKNICTGPTGCTIQAWGVYDSDQGANAGKPSYMLIGGFYIETSNGAWLFDTAEYDERRGVHGDTTSSQIITAINRYTDCNLIDDLTSFIPSSKDIFILQDSDNNEMCYISICER